MSRELIAEVLCAEPGCPETPVARTFCGPHYKVHARRNDLPPKVGNLPNGPAEFWSRVEKTSTCWLWRGSISRYGYGQFMSARKSWRAHRYVWELTRGPIPQGLVLDHLCRNRSCVNPDHLEVVTNRENVRRGIGPTAINARKQTCNNGHPLSGENLRIDEDGARLCIVCARRRSLKSTRKVRGETRICGAPSPRSASGFCAIRHSVARGCWRHGFFTPNGGDGE